jgi:hypothetical protein
MVELDDVEVAEIDIVTEQLEHLERIDGKLFTLFEMTQQFRTSILNKMQIMKQSMLHGEIHHFFQFHQCNGERQLFVIQQRITQQHQQMEHYWLKKQLKTHMKQIHLF